MAEVELYYSKASMACRTVLLTAGKIGLFLKKHPMKIKRGDTMKPEFVAINPLHSVPTIVDGDLVLTESRAICTYLISQYSKNSPLYPVDHKERAKIDRFLYFDFGYLEQRYKDYAMPALFRKEPVQPSVYEKLQESLKFLNGFLKDSHPFLCGDALTVADISVFSTIATMKAVGIGMEDHPLIGPWFERCRTELAGCDPEFSEGLTDYASGALASK